MYFITLWHEIISPHPSNQGLKFYMFDSSLDFWAVCWQLLIIFLSLKMPGKWIIPFPVLPPVPQSRASLPYIWVSLCLCLQPFPPSSQPKQYCQINYPLFRNLGRLLTAWRNQNLNALTGSGGHHQAALTSLAARPLLGPRFKFHLLTNSSIISLDYVGSVQRKYNASHKCN